MGSVYRKMIVEVYILTQLLIGKSELRNHRGGRWWRSQLLAVCFQGDRVWKEFVPTIERRPLLLLTLPVRRFVLWANFAVIGSVVNEIPASSITAGPRHGSHLMNKEVSWSDFCAIQADKRRNKDLR